MPIGDGLRLTVFGLADSVDHTHDAWRTLATVCVTPTAVWGPAIIALAIAYHRRRTRVREA
ncbi:hypothetical protein [Streptomyces sp. SJL17-4]|uniref:hypothetical protein n=1 Tax=Streptomyces sp. SJL17-4 TaxID=2967224 RepID=UPI0030CABC29